jgi:hypothetical protein
MLCDKHLLGEHVEMHMFVGTINKKVSIYGYIKGGLVEVHNIVNRHSEIVSEMDKRGMCHMSLLAEFESWHAGDVNVAANIVELKSRCKQCAKRIEDHELC